LKLRVVPAPDGRGQRRLRTQAGELAEIRDRPRAVQEMLALVKLDSFGARKPTPPFRRTRQRVALARARWSTSALILLDEPLAALDRNLREETRFRIDGSAAQARLDLHHRQP